jgi:hypothetical protein
MKTFLRSYWLTTLCILMIAGVLLTACTGYSKDPATKNVQRWTDTCAVYYEVLKGLGDAIELQTLAPESDVVQAFLPVRYVLRPICSSATPPDDVDTGDLQATLDKMLFELVKIQKGIP